MKDGRPNRRASPTEMEKNALRYFQPDAMKAFRDAGVA
jgi:hypothetical protein